MRTYYFLSFLWKSQEHDYWIPSSALTENEHPLDFISRATVGWSQQMPGFQIVMQFYREIPESVYRRHI